MADVLWQSFQSKIKGDDYTQPEDITVPAGWTRQLALDCEHLAYVLSIAYLNHSGCPFRILFRHTMSNCGRQSKFLGKHQSMLTS
jgi:hypothetical protein